MRPFMLAFGVSLAASGFVATAHADIALSSNDGHTVLDNGVQVAGKPPLADTVSIIDMGRYPPRIIGSFEAPGSVVGPPMAIAIAKDESWAIVTSATKADPAGTGGIGADDRVSVIDLRMTPPKIVQSLTAGAGATVVRMTPDGGLALVANRSEGTVSVFTIKDRRLTAAGKIELGNPKAGPSGVVISRDGRFALVSRDGDSIVSVLRIDGAKVTLDPRPITTAYRPYTMDINAAGTLAAVSNMGRGDGDIDSVSLIDLTATPPRTVETLSVPGSPEGLKFSPDGKFLAVGSQNGTTKPSGDMFRRDRGTLSLLGVDRHSLKRVTDASIGRWSQGIAFSRDGKTLMVQDMVEQHIQVFRWDGRKLLEGAALKIKGGPAAFATSWP
jgi:DNA-binding beta-propeller fold protein YncE